MKKNYIKFSILFVGLTLMFCNIINAQKPLTPPTPTTTINSCGPQTLTITTPPAGVTYYWQGTSCGVARYPSETTYSAPKSGNYYVRAYSCISNCGTTGEVSYWSDSCSVVSVTVKERPLPPNVTIVKSTNCGSLPVTLTIPTPPAPGFVQYFWQGTVCGQSETNNNTSYTVNDFGTASSYLVYANAKDLSTGCWSEACSYANAMVYPSPSSPAVQPAKYNSDGSVTLTAYGNPTNGDIWYWQGSTCGTITSISSSNTINITNPTPNTTTLFYVRAISAEGCWANSCSVGYFVGTEHNTVLNNVISVYPNPSNGDFNIKIDNIFKNVNITIINIMGQQIYNTKIYKENTEINLNYLPEGLYFIKFHYNNDSYIKKIIIEK